MKYVLNDIDEIWNQSWEIKIESSKLNSILSLAITFIGMWGYWSDKKVQSPPGCDHEFCTRCALYLCSTNCGTTISRGPPGSVSCPLCRNGIVSFNKLRSKALAKEIARTRLSFPIRQCSQETPSKPTPLTTQLRSLELCRVHDTPLGIYFCCHRLPSINLCRKTPDICHSLVPRCANGNFQNHLGRCWRIGLQQSTYSKSFLL